MARGGGKRRTYVRDNRGRFASTGATARGGRLKTAAGNKRKTVTARMAPAKAAGTIGKRKGLKARPVAAKPVAKVRPARPAKRPGMKKEYPIKDYVKSVRMSRQRVKSSPKGGRKAEEAQNEYKLSRNALRNRILRERGTRRRLKPRSTREILSGADANTLFY